MRIFVGDNLLRPTSPGAETYILTRGGIKLLENSGHPVQQAPQRIIVSRPSAQIEAVTLSLSPLKVLYQLVIISGSRRVGQFTLRNAEHNAEKRRCSLSFHKNKVNVKDYDAMQRDSAELLEAWEMDATNLKEDLLGIPPSKGTESKS